MSTVNIRRQGGAAIMTIPPEILRRLGLGVGSTLDVSVVDGALNARPHVAPERKRYTLGELLAGTTPEVARKLSEETAWAREGAPIGREI